jgi:hypothetical protein
MTARTIPTTDVYICPECRSRAVYLDASVDAHYDPNTGRTWTNDNDAYCDNTNGLIQCSDCGAADDHGSEWRVEFRYYRQPTLECRSVGAWTEVTRDDLIEAINQKETRVAVVKAIEEKPGHDLLINGGTYIMARRATS